MVAARSVILVVTALIGPTEKAPTILRGVPDTLFVAYTDRCMPDGWVSLPAPPGYPRLAARRAKLAALEDFPEIEWSIWADASYDLIADPREIVQEAKATGRDVVAFRHPDRHRIKDEAKEIIRLGLAPGDLVRRQIAEYVRCGFDCDDNPQSVITTAGFLIRRHTPAVLAFARRWLEEVERWTVREQLSGDFAARETGVEIGYLPGDYRANDYVRYNRVRHHLRRIPGGNVSPIRPARAFAPAVRIDTPPLSRRRNRL